MKIRNHRIGRHAPASAQGRFSTQFMMSRDVHKENLSRKKAIEESVKMDGFEVGYRQTGVKNVDRHQPSTCRSEFWIG